MDMGMADPAVVALPLSDSACNSQACDAFAAATNVSQAAVPWALQFEYGHWLTWSYLAVVFLFIVAYAYGLVVDRTGHVGGHVGRRPTFVARAVALLRCFSYRRLSGRSFDRLGLPSLGVLALFLSAVCYTAAATFAVRPYYRARDGYGSPPLAIRSGLMATALIPIIIALSGKFNILTVLTGISHEKLNAMHRYLAWLCFALSISHAIPFIVAPLRDGGAGLLHQDFYDPWPTFMFTGVPPWAMLTFLLVCSIPWIRARFYELFVYTHYMAAIAFFGLMFWHTGNLLDSWAYLWATLAIWLFSILGRLFVKSSALPLTGSWFRTFPTQMHRLSDDVAAIEVTVPHHYRWTPGQHCFLRFPGFAPLDNHPFTISSIPATVIADDEKAVLRPNTLKFLIRSYSGFTARLLQPVESNATACPQALVDGPYGGLARVVERSYDSVIGVAGGLGITAILPWIEHLARKMEMEPGRTATQQVHLIWMVKRRAQLSYLHAELLRIQSVFLARPSPITYELYVTAEHGDSAATPSAGDEKDGGALRPDGLAQSVHYGRPDLRSLVPSRVSQPRTYVLDRWRDAFMNPPCYLAR